jgi:hypothetical protein
MVMVAMVDMRMPHAKISPVARRVKDIGPLLP